MATYLSKVTPNTPRPKRLVDMFPVYSGHFNQLIEELNEIVTAKDTLEPESMVITPISNKDALDIILSSANGWTSRSGIDIDLIGYVGFAALPHAGIIDISTTNCVLTGDAYFYKLSGAGITVNNVAVNLVGNYIDFFGVTDTNFATFYGTKIAMPATYQGTQPTAAGYYTGADAIVEILTGTSTISGVKVTTAAATEALTIDADTTDRTTGNLISVDLGISASAVNMFYASIDVKTALTADISRGLYLDINDIAASTDTSALIGYDGVLSAVSTSRSDLIGYKITIDGTQDGADTTYGLQVIDTRTQTNATFRGLSVNGTGGIHTSGNWYGLDIQATNAGAAGLKYGVNVAMPGIYAGATHYAFYAVGDGIALGLLANDIGAQIITSATSEAININATVNDKTNDGNLVTLNYDINGTAMVAGAVGINLSTNIQVALAAGVYYNGIRSSLNQVVESVDTSMQNLFYADLTTLSGDRSDVSCYIANVSGTKDAGADYVIGYLADIDNTINNGVNSFGFFVDATGYTHTNGTFRAFTATLPTTAVGIGTQVGYRLGASKIDTDNPVDCISFEQNATAVTGARTFIGRAFYYSSILESNGFDLTQQTNPLIDFDITLTETANICSFTGGIFQATIVVGDGTPTIYGNMMSLTLAGTNDQAQALRGYYIDANSIILDNAGASFYGFGIDTSGLTRTSATVVYGLYCNVKNDATAGIYITNTTVTAALATPTHAAYFTGAVKTVGDMLVEDAYRFNPGNQHYYFDDFDSNAAALGGVIPAELTLADYYWDVSASIAGTATIIAEADPFLGKVRLDTTAVGNSTSLMNFRQTCYQGGLRKQFRTRFVNNSGALTNTTLLIGWYATANDYCVIHFDTTDNAANIYLASNNNGVGEQRDDTTVDMVLTTIYDVIISIDGTTITASINGTAVTITNCTVRDLDTFRPYLCVNNKAAAEQKIIDVDFVQVFQDRT